MHPKTSLSPTSSAINPATHFLRPLSAFLAVVTFVLGILGTTPGEARAQAGLEFTSIAIYKSGTDEKVADLLAGERPQLKAGTIYTFDIAYNVPASLQFSPTYLKVELGDGLYANTLPGATFTPGPISSTGFEELVAAPEGTGTAPYGYPGADSPKRRSGSMVYKTKGGLVQVRSYREITFVLDDAFENESADQVLASVVKMSLGTTADAGTDPKVFDVVAADALSYGFYTEQMTEVVSKGGTTERLQASSTGGMALTEQNSSTTVQIVYPKDIELVGLGETSCYHRDGVLGATTIEGDNKVTTVSWDEAGSYSGGLRLMPRLKVASDSTRPNGDTFTVTIRNLRKTVWNDTPNADRTSKDASATLRVQIIDGANPEVITSRNLIDTASNWALKKYDTYNTRLGALLVKNELMIPTAPKTLEMEIDQDDAAIIRGVTIPYKEGMSYGPIRWTSSDGKSGEADPSVLQRGSVSALLTNTALGLDPDVSIKSIKVDLGPIPGGYDGIKPMQDLLAHYNKAPYQGSYYVYDEFYGWGYIANGVYGSWKQGQSADVRSTVRLYTTGEAPSAPTTIVGISSAPEVLNGVGKIDKTQINGGDGFRISGKIDDGNWDWNPLQEPVLYVFMPRGFSYSNLTVTEGSLGEAEYVGEFEKDGIPVQVWRHRIDIGTQTRGQYQPDFTTKSMALGMDVQTNKLAAVGTYHINDFLGFTTKDFKEIGAVIKREKWDGTNWNTEKYTSAFGDKVNSGETMVSLAEATGVQINQASKIAAAADMSVHVKANGSTKPYAYDPGDEATIAVLQKGNVATIHIGVRNDAGIEPSVTTLYVPLLSTSKDFGQSFMPKGETELPLELAGTTSSDNFRLEYLRLHDGVTLDLNKAPAAGDYDVVTDASQANMVRFVADAPLSAGNGGWVEVSYRAGDDLDATHNDKLDVITPVLDYDINHNHSTLTLEPAAMTFRGTDIVLTKLWADHGDLGMIRPSAQDFAQGLTLSSSVAQQDVSGFIPRVTDEGDGSYTVKYPGLPQYFGDRQISYTVREGSFAGYVAKNGVTSVSGAGNKVEGSLENVYSPTPVKHDPPVQKLIEGPAPASPDNFEFTLRAESDSFPMPDGSSNGRKTVSVTGAGAAEFGDITFSLPGVYTYTITEERGGAGCTYDASVYKLSYTVTDDGTGTLVAARSLSRLADGHEEAVDLGADGQDIGAVFTNTYPTPVTATKVATKALLPKTADETASGTVALAAGCGLLALAALLRRRRA